MGTASLEAHPTTPTARRLARSPATRAVLASGSLVVGDDGVVRCFQQLGSLCTGAAGVFVVVAARQHYLSDVLVALFITELMKRVMKSIE